MESSWESFHQQEALTTRLSNILEEYPPGVSSLREFVQNADDAGANRLVICLDAAGDAEAAASDTWPTEALRSVAGPSLLIYNDAAFSEKDFQSISSIGHSRKREDGATIGKYGLGFNVAYHFTDTPTFVSADSLVVFDPHGTSLPEGQLGLRAKLSSLGTAGGGLASALLGPLALLEGRDRGESAMTARLGSTLCAHRDPN
jgi:hypothetical protein